MSYLAFLLIGRPSNGYELPVLADLGRGAARLINSQLHCPLRPAPAPLAECSSEWLARLHLFSDLIHALLEESQVWVSQFSKLIQNGFRSPQILRGARTHATGGFLLPESALGVGRLIKLQKKSLSGLQVFLARISFKITK